jgi:hypothetical protein
MVGDSPLGMVILFGDGNEENAAYADTWAQDGDNWNRLQPPDLRPRARMCP